MMDLDEALSRLIDGDLEPDAGAELRRRIMDEPLVAARYRDLQALVVELEALPEELPVRRPQRPKVLHWAGWVAAAAMLAWILVPATPTAVLQTWEHTEYDGLFRVHAGDVRVELDGNATIAVEPSTGPVRVGAQEDSMKPIITHGLALAAGALVTVAVHSGTATVHADTGAVEIHPGEQRSFGQPRAEPPPVVQRTRNRDEPTEDLRVAQLEAELAAVREALGQERFAKILLDGQLVAERGLPTEWPATLDARLGAEEFPRELAALVAELPGFEIVSTDCEEYPCIGALKYTGDDPLYMRAIGDRIGEWAKEPLDGEVSLSMANLEDKGEGDASQRYIVFSAHGEDRGSNVAQRAGRRMEDLGERLLE